MPSGGTLQSVTEEKDHFDQLARERENHHFIPDLRRMGDNDYFYLSAFRRQALAQIGLDQYIAFARQCVTAYLPPRAKVLDLGCGNGWFALELARLGLEVTALDLSEENIRLAQAALREADLSPGYGSISYYAGDLHHWSAPETGYAAAFFLGALHHLAEVEPVLTRYASRLGEPGYLFCADPFINNYQEPEALIALLVRLCLASCGAWYEDLPLPSSEAQLEALLQDTLREYRTWSDKKEAGNQSPTNNAASGAEIQAAIQKHFQILEQGPLFTVLQRLIGGVRLKDDAHNLAFAQTWALLEKTLQRQQIMRPGGYMFWGVKR